MRDRNLPLRFLKGDLQLFLFKQMYRKVQMCKTLFPRLQIDSEEIDVSVNNTGISGGMDNGLELAEELWREVADIKLRDLENTDISFIKIVHTEKANQPISCWYIGYFQAPYRGLFAYEICRPAYERSKIRFHR